MKVMQALEKVTDEFVKKVAPMGMLSAGLFLIMTTSILRSKDDFQTFYFLFFGSIGFALGFYATIVAAIKKTLSQPSQKHLPKSLILYICPELSHKSGKKVRLIFWWHRDRLVVKDINAPGYSGLHYFPDEYRMKGKSLSCPTIDMVGVREDGEGWNVEGETAEGDKFEFAIKHDFTEEHAALSSCYIVF